MWPATCEYQERDGRIVRVTSPKGGGLQEVPLTNFVARIVANIVEDDGVSIHRQLSVDVSLRGRHLTIQVPASKFSTMDWPIEQLGGEAIVYPNQKEHARVAIQTLSPTIIDRHVYSHTGWCQINGRHYFLHGGGAIGKEEPEQNIEVSLSTSLSRYTLRMPSERPSCVLASLRLLSLGPPIICFPLLAATYRAVLGNVDFGVWLTGQSGAFKSELAALCQQHFGPEMDARHLPGNWSSTSNAIESSAFHAKDVLYVVDDFSPRGSQSEVQCLHDKVERLFRNIGNGQSRGRLASDATIRPERPPRGLALSTGEDVPRTQSIQARMLILEICSGQVDPEALSRCQADALEGLYAEAMAGFIRWLCGHCEPPFESFRLRTADLRRKIISTTPHPRTPGIIANLQAAFELFVRFAEHAGALNHQEAMQLEEHCWQTLNDVAQFQMHHQVSNEPGTRFRELLRAALVSGDAYIANHDGGEPPGAGRLGWRRPRGRPSQGAIPQGACMGWIGDDGDLYLEPTVAFTVAQQLATRAGESMAITAHVLRKRLKDQKLLARVDRKRGTITVRKTLQGAMRDVLHVAGGFLGDIEYGLDSRSNGLSRSEFDTVFPKAINSLEEDVGNVGFYEPGIGGECDGSATDTDVARQVYEL